MLFNRHHCDLCSFLNISAVVKCNLSAKTEIKKLLLTEKSQRKLVAFHQVEQKMFIKLSQLK